MRQHTERLYLWAIDKATSSKAPFWISLLFILELFLFIPLDAVLMFFCLQDKKKTLLYVTVATLASVLSGLLGYLIGHFLWDLVGPLIVPTLIKASTFANISAHLEAYEALTVFLGALLPFPLKALSVTAGVFHLGLGPFLFYLFLARALRFSLIGVSMFVWGEKVKVFVDKHFHKIFVAIGAKIAAAALFFWVLAN